MVLRRLQRSPTHFKACGTFHDSIFDFNTEDVLAHHNGEVHYNGLARVVGVLTHFFRQQSFAKQSMVKMTVKPVSCCLIYFFKGIGETFSKIFSFRCPLLYLVYSCRLLRFRFYTTVSPVVQHKVSTSLCFHFFDHNAVLKTFLNFKSTFKRSKHNKVFLFKRTKGQMDTRYKI